MQVTTKPEYLDRFRSTLAGLGIGKADRILLAVSGGPDSLALLILAAETMPGAIFAVTIDHQLRPESATEAAFVAMSCAELAVPHATLTPAVPITGNIQSAARVARYQLLEQTADDQNCTLIATAHHGDDQLETILMRLARGSGIDGMSAIRARNGRIIRPLLGFSKSELEEICLSAGIEPVRDPSNENEDYDRVAIRKWLGQSSHPFTIERSNRTASALSDCADALTWMTDALSAERISQNSDIIQCNGNDLPRELRRRLLLECIRRLDDSLQPRGDAIDRLLATLELGNSGSIGGLLCRGGAVWHISHAPPRRNGG